MAEGDIEIDPEGPNLDQQQQALARYNAIIDASDMEALALLFNDKRKFSEICQQMWKNYIVQIVAYMIFDLGLVFCALAIFLNFNSVQQTRVLYERCTQENAWSEWSSIHHDYSKRERCGSIQYMPTHCPGNCHSNLSTGYFTTLPDNAKESDYVYCENEKKFVKKSL